jgi:hypothetical protein
LTAYCPQPGDVVLYSNTDIMWSTLYALALTGSPGHSGLIVRMDDGRLGVMEAGYDDTIWNRLVPLDERFTPYKGTIWIRKRKAPICKQQSRILTEFAEALDGHRYAVGRLLGQVTPLRSRGPLRTAFVGKPKGFRRHYTCSEAVLEGLVMAGLIDPKTARPAATYPRDLFFDRSPNLYINRHPPLIDGWEPPAMWSSSEFRVPCSEFR